MLYIRKHTSSISEQSFKHSSAWCSSERALLNTWKHLFVIKLVFLLINKYLLVCLFFSNLLLVWRIFSCLLVVVAVCLAQLDQLQQIQQERHLNQCFQRFFSHSFSCKTKWNQMCDPPHRLAGPQILWGNCGKRGGGRFVIFEAAATPGWWFNRQIMTCKH